ncbi:MAG: CvpA family protein [Lentisphaerae bacterium]|nr:CvpA family protein [Lentisphaerota bacterium]
MFTDLPVPGLLDVVAVAVIALAALRGSFRGMSGELAGLFGNAAALMAGIVCYHPLGDWLIQHSKFTGRAAFATAFIAIVLACIIVMLILRWTLGRVLHVVVEDGINRTGGVIAGVVRGILFTTTVFIAMNLIPHEGLNRRFGEESLVGTLVQRATPHLRNVIENAGNFEFLYRGDDL